MSLKQPESVDECVYFTRRSIGNGKVMAWVFREKCSKCNKGIMGKPRDASGKVKIRAKEYVCESCGYTIEKGAYEDTLTANISYICPHCGHSGETQVSFKRKKVQIFDEEEQKKVTVDALRSQCSKCSKNIEITKKMK